MAGPNFDAAPPQSMNPGLSQQPLPQPPVQKRKQSLNIYTVLLIISFISLLVGIFALYNILNGFDEVITQPIR